MPWAVFPLTKEGNEAPYLVTCFPSGTGLLELWDAWVLRLFAALERVQSCITARWPCPSPAWRQSPVPGVGMLSVLLEQRPNGGATPATTQPKAWVYWHCVVQHLIQHVHCVQYNSMFLAGAGVLRWGECELPRQSNLVPAWASLEGSFTSQLLSAWAEEAPSFPEANAVPKDQWHFCFSIPLWF